jgi:DNA-directed RNA polymerase specialized sigma24 family protein
MDVHEAGTQAGTFRRRQGTGAASGAPSRARIGQALGEWQASELRYMSRHPYCRDLDLAQLEDLYQETVLALLNRPYFNEEHLRNALRFGLSKRALHVHRDERRRGEILTAHAPEAHRVALHRSEIAAPEHAALVREDGRIVLEFTSELTPAERQVYALEAEGLRYRAIAPILRIELNAARRASRSLASKRKRFQLLHDTGRLCGYRAPTIRALIAGESTSEQLAIAAFAHLDACASCRAEHRTNAKRLRLSFQQRAAALLPVPALVGHLGFLTHVDVRIRTLTHRWLPELSSSGGGGGLRERVIATATSTGVAAKLAAGAATVAVIAGGTITATRPANHPHRTRGHHRRVTRPAAQATAAATPQDAQAPAISTASTPAGTRGGTPRAKHPREPGGFAFLGVPAASATPAPARARVASTAPQTQREPAPRKHGESLPQKGGGPFSP